MLSWKATLLGLLTIGAGVLIAVLAHWLPAGLRVSMWAIYGSCLAILSLGLAIVALSFEHRKVALAFYTGSLAGIIGIATAFGLTRAIASCTAAISGISIARPGLVCQGAYAVGAVAVTVLLSFVIIGFLGRQNAA
jgi:hypothetical protein